MICQRRREQRNCAFQLPVYLDFPFRERGGKKTPRAHCRRRRRRWSAGVRRLANDRDSFSGLIATPQHAFMARSSIVGDCLGESSPSASPAFHRAPRGKIPALSFVPVRSCSHSSRTFAAFFLIAR